MAISDALLLDVNTAIDYVISTSAMSTVFSCSMCSFYATDNDRLVSHVCKIHRYDPNFLIYCSRCLRSFRVWDTYKKHLYRGCTAIARDINPEEDVSITTEDDDTMDVTEYLGAANSEPSKS